MARARSVLMALVGLTLGACQRPPATAVVPGLEMHFRDHSDAVATAAGELLPLYLGAPPRLCLSAPVTTDTTSWRLSFDFPGQPEAESAAPFLRRGTTLCFTGQWPADGSAGELELCPRLLPSSAAEAMALPCRKVVYQARGGTFSPLAGEFNTLAADPEGGEPWDDLARRAGEAGYPLLALRARLVAIDRLLRGNTAAQRAAARRRLTELDPAQLTHSAASSLAGDAELLWARLEQAEGRWQNAWQNLTRARAAYDRIASDGRLPVVMAQAAQLARQGALREALVRLRNELAEPGAESSPFGVDGLQLLAWFTLGDPNASVAELDTADAALATAGTSATVQGLPLEAANLEINAALLALARGADPTPARTRAERCLARVEPSPARTELELWSTLVSGRAALARGELASAERDCRTVTAAASEARLRGYGWSCQAEIHERRGRAIAALEAWRAAISAGTEPGDLERRFPRSLDLEAERVYRAVGAAVKAGQVAAGWRLLSEMAGGPSAGRCRGPRRLPGRAGDLGENETRLRSELAELEAGVADSPPVAAQIRHLKEQLEELAAERECLAPTTESTGEPAAERAELRAVPVADEILLLARDAAGGTTLVRRTPFPRHELRRVTERLTAALETRHLPDAELRALAAPLGAALAPPARAEGVVFYGLYGLLQEAPLGALPLDDGWLGTRFVPVVVPAGVPRHQRPTLTHGPAVFILDPERNLPSSAELETFFLARAAPARTLAGEAASHAAVTAAFRGAWRLHLGTHGRYDPAFPRLSSLRLADGEITLDDLLRALDPQGSPELVDLAGCHTGRWPPTADRGQFGLAGALARWGVPWTLGSRSTLDDRVAADFARAFYLALEAGEPVPRAFGDALATLASRHRAVDWGGLTLFSSGGGATAGRDDSHEPEGPALRNARERPAKGTT